MNNSRKEIINLIQDYMNKILAIKCLVRFEEYWNIEEIKDMAYSSWCTVFYTMNNNYEIEDRSKIEIIWHYDITAVLKYIKNNLAVLEFEINDDYFSINWWFYKIPNKPLHLYTEQEELQLLELLLKLK